MRMEGILRIAAAVMLGLLPFAGSAGEAKWPASKEVRQGMAAIRAIVVRNHTPITHRRISAGEIARFAAELQMQVDRLIANTISDIEQRARLRRILPEIDAGAQAVAQASGSMQAIDGLERIDKALEEYRRLFDDPDWQPLR
jgi:hypothetical protein